MVWDEKRMNNDLLKRERERERVITAQNISFCTGRCIKQQNRECPMCVNMLKAAKEK